MSLATIDDLKRHIIYAGGKITIGSDPEDTLSTADATSFLEDAYALIEQKYEDADATSDNIRRLLIRWQCLETFIMITNTYNHDVKLLQSLNDEINRIQQYLLTPINFAHSVRGGGSLL